MVQQEILDKSAELSKTPILDRIENIKEELTEIGNEAQKIRRKPDWGSNTLADAGLYRHTMPTELGGEDMLARKQIEVIEATAAIDGSVGWCVQINSEINALILRQMELGLAHEIADD